MDWKLFVGLLLYVVAGLIGFAIIGGFFSVEFFKLSVGLSMLGGTFLLTYIQELHEVIRVK